MFFVYSYPSLDSFLFSSSPFLHFFLFPCLVSPPHWRVVLHLLHPVLTFPCYYYRDFTVTYFAFQLHWLRFHTRVNRLHTRHVVRTLIPFYEFFPLPTESLSIIFFYRPVVPPPSPPPTFPPPHTSYLYFPPFWWDRKGGETSRGTKKGREWGKTHGRREERMSGHSTIRLLPFLRVLPLLAVVNACVIALCLFLRWRLKHWLAKGEKVSPNEKCPLTVSASHWFPFHTTPSWCPVFHVWLFVSDPAPTVWQLSIMCVLRSVMLASVVTR